MRSRLLVSFQELVPCYVILKSWFISVARPRALPSFARAVNAYVRRQFSKKCVYLTISMQARNELESPT
jgi:hypothetical protein